MITLEPGVQVRAAQCRVSPAAALGMSLRNVLASIPVDYPFRTFFIFRFLSSIYRTLDVSDSLTACQLNIGRRTPSFRQLHTSPIPVTPNVPWIQHVYKPSERSRNL